MIGMIGQLFFWLSDFVGDVERIEKCLAPDDHVQ